MSELSGNDKIVEAGEVRAYKRLLVPRKETAKINELAINDAGSLVTTSSAGVQQIIGPSVAPPPPGFAAVSAADGTSITRPITVTGGVTATDFSGPTGQFSTSATTPLVTSAAGQNLAMNSGTGMLVLAQDNILTSVPPSAPVTATTAAPNTSLALEKASATCGTLVITTSQAAGGVIVLTFPRKSTGITDIQTMLTVQDGGWVDPTVFSANKGAVQYFATTFTVQVYFNSTVATNIRVQYLNIDRQ